MADLLRSLSAFGTVLLLAACATTPPAASPTVSASATPSASTPAPSTSPSISPSISPSGSPSVSPSGTPTPGVTAIELQGKGIDTITFGAAEREVTALLTAKAGKADDSYSGPVCELDDATPYGRQLAYGAYVFLFQSKNRGTSKSPRTFTSWVINLDQQLNPAFKLADGYPMSTTFAKLKTAFPKGKLSKIALGESAVYVFRTPSGIWYRGDDNKQPTDVGAGAMGTCE